MGDDFYYFRDDMERRMKALETGVNAERNRYRKALEEIADGDGCNSRHGPGCNHRCKDIAREALKG